MPASQTAPREHGKLAAIVRHHGPDSHYAHEARRDLRFAQLRNRITEVVAEAPPLTLDQVAELGAILRGKQ